MVLNVVMVGIGNLAGLVDLSKGAAVIEDRYGLHGGFGKLSTMLWNWQRKVGCLVVWLWNGLNDSKLW